MTLPTNVKIGVIGGSGLYSLDHLEVVNAGLTVETPWGAPSSPITVAQASGGVKVAFLSRHGSGHSLSPSEVPSRANIAALKLLGCRLILAFSAVGSLREEIAPGDFVIPSQIIDRTKGVRPGTFFQDGVVAHVPFADPFDAGISEFIASIASETSGIALHRDKTLVCMEGPAFSTRAESHLYRAWGADIINMSVLPESKLAREAEMGYVMICMATDYDCWRVSEEAVTVEAVMATMGKNGANAKRLLGALIPKLYREIVVMERTEECGLAVEGPMKGVAGLKGVSRMSITTKPEARDEEVMKKLAWLNIV